MERKQSLDEGEGEVPPKAAIGEGGVKNGNGSQFLKDGRGFCFLRRGMVRQMWIKKKKVALNKQEYNELQTESGSRG